MHATTPFKRRGTDKTIEDALVLEKKRLVTVQTTDQPNAFVAYSQMERSASQKTLTTDGGARLLLGMKQEGAGSHLLKTKQHLETRLH